MSKFLSFFLLALSLVGIASTTSSISTFAQGNPGGEVVVTTKAGLNVRDANCNVKETLPYQTTVFDESNTRGSIKCTVKGVTYNMIAVGYFPSQEGYIAPNFVSPVLGGNNFNTPVATVTATAGLNVRDQNCKKVGLLKYNSPVKIAASDNFITCKVNGAYYRMVPIDYNLPYNTFVASQFIK